MGTQLSILFDSGATYSFWLC